MARSRLLHPEFARHEVLGHLSPLHRLLFALLPTLADREGKLEDRPERIKVDLFPYDPDTIDVDRLLSDLEKSGFIVRYEAGDKLIISIPGFERWQKPHPREKHSELQNCPKDAITGSAKGSPKASLRLALGTPRKPVSVSVSVSDPVSDPVTVSTTLPEPTASGGKEPGRTVATRQAYEAAFRERWGQAPLGSKSINGILGQFVDLVGAKDAPGVAAFYVRHPQALYVNAKHPVNLLLRDAQKLQVEWSTSDPSSWTQAAQQERTHANVKGWSMLLPKGEPDAVG